MIEIAPATFILLYLGVAFSVPIFLWVYNHLRKKNNKITIQENSLTICEYCHYAYLAELSKSLTQCPECHSYNKKKT